MCTASSLDQGWSVLFFGPFFVFFFSIFFCCDIFTAHPKVNLCHNNFFSFNKYFTNAVTRSPVASVCSSLGFRNFSSPVTRRRVVFQFTEVTESFVLNQQKSRWPG